MDSPQFLQPCGSEAGYHADMSLGLPGDDAIDALFSGSDDIHFTEGDNYAFDNIHPMMEISSPWGEAYDTSSVLSTTPGNEVGMANMPMLPETDAEAANTTTNSDTASPRRTKGASSPGALEAPPKLGGAALVKEDPACFSPSPTPSATTDKVAEDSGAKKRKQKKSKRPAVSNMNEERRLKFLERNRLAASKCRQKRKQQEIDMQRSRSELEEANKSLQTQCHQLFNEMTQLRKMLVAHRDCKDAAISDWIASQASHIASEPCLTVPATGLPARAYLRSPAQSTTGNGLVFDEMSALDGHNAVPVQPGQPSQPMQAHDFRHQYPAHQPQQLPGPYGQDQPSLRVSQVPSGQSLKQAGQQGAIKTEPQQPPAHQYLHQRPEHQQEIMHCTRLRPQIQEEPPRRHESLSPPYPVFANSNSGQVQGIPEYSVMQGSPANASQPSYVAYTSAHAPTSGQSRNHSRNTSVASSVNSLPSCGGPALPMMESSSGRNASMASSSEFSPRSSAVLLSPTLRNHPGLTKSNVLAKSANILTPPASIPPLSLDKVEADVDFGLVEGVYLDPMLAFPSPA